MLGVLRADPALTGEKAGHALPLGDVLGVVPIVELVLGDVREIHRRDQNTFRHDRSLRLCGPKWYAKNARCARGYAAMPFSASCAARFR